MKIHLDSQPLTTVRGILENYGLAQVSFVFGSRARGDHKKYSDLDVLIKLEKPLEASVLIGLKNAFEASALPFTVDVVEWSKISEDFKRNIENELLPLLSSVQ